MKLDTWCEYIAVGLISKEGAIKAMREAGEKYTRRQVCETVNRIKEEIAREKREVDQRLF